MSKLTIKGVQQHLTELENVFIFDTDKRAKHTYTDGTLRYLPLGPWGVVIYPKSWTKLRGGLYSRVSIRTKFWAAYDYLDHLPDTPAGLIGHEK